MQPSFINSKPGDGSTASVIIQVNVKDHLYRDGPSQADQLKYSVINWRQTVSRTLIVFHSSVIVVVSLGGWTEDSGWNQNLYLNWFIPAHLQFRTLDPPKANVNEPLNMKPCVWVNESVCASRFWLFWLYWSSGQMSLVFFDRCVRAPRLCAFIM